MKKTNKKGFTIVELVIVIAVIGILSAVLIPTFSGLIEKAKYTNDTEVCTNMRTSLFIEYDVEIPANIVEVQHTLKEEYANDFIPKTSNLHYYWCELDNYVYLVNDSNNGFVINYPDTETKASVTSSNSYRLDLEYCLINTTIDGVTLDKKVLVVGQDNTVTLTGISASKVQISGELKDLTSDKKITLNPTTNSTITIEQDPTIYVSSVSVDPNEKQLYVGGTQQLEAVIVPDNATTQTVTWSSDTTSVATVSDTGLVEAISAGTATITVTTTDGGKIGTCIVTVSKNTASVNAPSAKSNLTYNTNPQSLVNEGEIVGSCQWQYKLGTGEYSTTIPSATNAGTYTVYYKLIGDNTYNDIAEASVQVTIGKADAIITVDQTAIIKNYGEAIEIPVATTNFGTVDCNKVAGDLVNVGSYTITYIVTGTSNYNGDTKTVEVTINKADATLTTAPTANNSNVTDQPINLVIAGSATGGELQYAIGENDTTAPETGYSETIPQATIAGTYYVWYKVVGYANYNDITPVCITVTISEVQ